MFDKIQAVICGNQSVYFIPFVEADVFDYIAESQYNAIYIDI